MVDSAAAGSDCGSDGCRELDGKDDDDGAQQQNDDDDEQREALGALDVSLQHVFGLLES